MILSPVHLIFFQVPSTSMFPVGRIGIPSLCTCSSAGHVFGWFSIHLYCVGASRLCSSQLSRIRCLQSLEPWRPRDVRPAGRHPPRRAARGRRPGGRPSAARRRAARSAVPAGASPRRVAMMPKFVVRLCLGFRLTVGIVQAEWVL